jgi:hypothetical protein
VHASSTRVSQEIGLATGKTQRRQSLREPFAVSPPLRGSHGTFDLDVDRSVRLVYFPYPDFLLTGALVRLGLGGVLSAYEYSG